jgi:S-adenosylhomocysteine hydrolase
VKQKRLKERPIRTITVIICSLLLYSKAIALEDLPIKGKLIYQNNLSTEADVANWIMEGPGVIEFKDGWMELFSPNAEFHHVFWCREDFPDNFVAEWDVQNLNTASGL